MSFSRKIGAPIFALLCLAMAAMHQFNAHLDKTFIGLVLLATVPWFLPWLLPLVASLKVGGLELNFRELKTQVEENKQMVQATASALATGVGKAPAFAPPPPMAQ